MFGQVVLAIAVIILFIRIYGWTFRSEAAGSLADKKKCISCNVCTSVCHQGIDIMNFANKGLHMADPEYVRCSACVQSCPTGVLTFAQVDRGGREIY